MKTLVLILAAIIFIATPIAAQTQTPTPAPVVTVPAKKVKVAAQVDPCATDLKILCASSIPSGRPCLRARQQGGVKLAPACAATFTKKKG